MKIIGRNIAEDFLKKHSQARRPFLKWLATVENASWKKFEDIKKTFNSSDWVNGDVVFDIKGNDYRLIAIVEFRNGILIIKHIFTHSEYERFYKK